MTRGGKVTFTHELEVPPSQGEGMEYDYVMLDVEARITDFHPAVYYQRNGDPGWPAEGGEVEDLTVSWPDGTEMDPIPNALYEILSEKAREQQL